MDKPWRKLSSREEDVLKRLLHQPFNGHEDLLVQLEKTEVRNLFDDGTLELRVYDESPRANVPLRVPVEAEFVDSDGVEVLLLLHVVDGLLHTFEVVKGDDSPIVEPPVASNLEVRVKT